MGIRYKTLPQLLTSYQTNNNMYTTNKATREQGLKAAAAANRAMNRFSCCKSQFKFKCFSCGEMVNRGDKITRCMRGTPTGMVLRYRGGDSSNGLIMAETAFYQGESGPDMWVHLGCKPCYWDSLPRGCNEYSPPSLRPITTEWGIRMREEFYDWCGGIPSQVVGSYPMFCMVKGYPHRFPERTPMRERIIHAITRIQAMWRGYKSWKPPPRDIVQKELKRMAKERAKEACKKFILASLGGFKNDVEYWEYELDKVNKALKHIENERCVMTPLTVGDIAMANALAEQKFLRETNVGHRFGILFNRGEKSEALYSGEITSMWGEHNGLVVYVRFHHDGERRKYHWKKFVSLTFECNKFMEKMGISQFHGVIFTQKR